LRRGLTLALAVALIAFLPFTLYVMFTGKDGSKENGKLFPFYLPWNDTRETAVSLAAFIDKPAGKYGHVYVGGDGHLYVGGRRIKFLGVNICGSAAFPRKEDAEMIAARLAKFGINLVRFHHMDASWESFNIFDKRYGDTRHLSREALDRLDFFIAKLKENGIYVDLNLLVSRRFRSADGLPNEIELVDWKDQQVLGFFMDEVRELEKEYAKQLLTHRNPYTGLTYAEDPAVAFIEIVNEQGLIHGWLGGVMDRLPSVFKERLRALWNEYLREKYGSTARLLEAWTGTPVAGKEMLTNGRFNKGVEGWGLEVHGDAQALFKVVEMNGAKSLEVRVTKPGSEGWYVQINYPDLNVKEGVSYLLVFRARADRDAVIHVSLRQAHEPWKALSQIVELRLTNEWKEYRVVLAASGSDLNARLDLTNLGAVAATYYFTDFSLRPFTAPALREGESLENGTVPLFTLADFWSRPVDARRDWGEFLWSLEQSYFIDMYRFLKEELGVRSLVIGTVVGCSTPNVMALMDVVDAHAYWHHPVFPDRPWDPGNWYVVNEPMVDSPLASTIQWLAFKRVYGMPFTVTEYNHPAPNTYDAETVVVLAAYAALQDWDAILLFDYGRLDDWDARRIRGYFDVDQHPAKMATLIPAFMIFVRGDVEPARELVAIRLDREDEIEMVVEGRVRAWNLPDAGLLGVDTTAPLVHRVALIVDGKEPPEKSLSPGEVETPPPPAYRSDNGQVTWLYTGNGKGVVVVNASRTIAVAGFGGGKSFDFGDVVVEPGDSLLEGFSVIALTVMEGGSFKEFSRLLLVAVGYVGNTGMVIREYGSGKALLSVVADLGSIKSFKGKVTCSGDWGKAPTLVEGVPATLKLRARGSVEVWALDNTGKRTVRVPVSVENGYAVFTIGPRYKTIWYEVVVKS